ncbi:MAG TPA: leucyl/phenylalanyl-tRNA--protein transferase [Candidatus Competibacteraceae bacterium]|nr:MAG: leucyl/phenylalanyl-tRNA--protein transferase [Candidatus Competibacteraceae bacterium]HOB61378.1 leucyl/phenylalanyl-tRNA--protein transferase [Candidatus Competibacteraceae bacterium]HQA25945.1 leucyl/phenylalanyl-tRNA--protein transferase [Candidatus Competibacteraceae bacterium]HQD56700.1 leucyl/phenylalanyl-tRNA--protein transferase [Candidatus Competibacteraceae bacterium]
MRLPWLDPRDDNQPFPSPDRALTDPDGLLAAGGSLSPRRLLRAYRLGIFPWYSTGQPILWWSPDPRLVLFPECVNVSRSLRKTLRKGAFAITADTVFEQIITACAGPRDGDPGTWITPEMHRAYCRLHRLGHAHSVEVWRQGKLVGGLYGVAVGRVFFGESMFHWVSDASKVALVALAQQLRRWEFAVIDCQVRTEHLASLGAVDIARPTFLQLLDRYCALPGHDGAWRLDPDLWTDWSLPTPP